MLCCPVCNSRGSIGCDDEFALETGDRGTTARNIQGKLTPCFVVHALLFICANVS